MGPSTATIQGRFGFYMIITRTPYRISFFGGGTDFPAYYEKHGGCVLSATINKYSHLHCRVLPPFFDHNYCIRYFQTERVRSIEEIQHPSVRECLRYLSFPRPLEILHSGDIPAMSGIGSSSSFTVGLLLALHGLAGRMVTKRELAWQAMLIEQELIGECVGSQDQFAAAFGGFNRIDFNSGNQIVLSPIIMDGDRMERLQDSLLFCFSGIARYSFEIQKEMVSHLAEKGRELTRMKELVDEAQRVLTSPVSDLDDFGRLLDQAWQIKRRLSSKVSSGLLDNLYETALRAGALGGKVCGAGGGGFMVFYVPIDKKQAVTEALNKTLQVPMQFEHLGAHVIFYSHSDR